MDTTVADTLFNRLIDAFPADRPYGSTAFSRDPMPSPLRDYLEQRMALRLEDVAPPTDDWIDADHHEVGKALEAYRDVLARHLEIPASSWRTELGRACATVVSYLIRPAHALTDLVFADGKEDATLEEISEQFRLVPSYTYFEDVIGAYFEQKDLEQISKERFSGLARRIDHQMVRDFEADEWMKLLQPLLGLVRVIPEFSGGLPVDVLKTFFQEKGANDLIARLEKRFESRGVRLVRDSELRDFFEQPEEETPTNMEPGKGTSLEGAATPPERSVRRDAPSGGSHVPLWKQFESGLGPSPEQGPTPKSSGGASNAVSAGASEAQPLWKQFRGAERSSAGRQTAPREERALSERATPEREPAPREERAPSERATPEREPAPPAPSITPKPYHAEPSRATRPPAHASAADALIELERSVLGQKGSRNRDLFLRHLFSGSENAYEDTLRKLNVAENWSEASQIIAREVFLKHQVNIYSDPAVAFTDAAEARFRS